MNKNQSLKIKHRYIYLDCKKQKQPSTGKANLFAVAMTDMFQQRT